MEYFTTAEQEQAFQHRYQKRWEQEQDRIRSSRFRAPGHQEIQEDDRMFFVEPDGSVYLGEVKPDTLCPTYPHPGGKCYEVDPLFLREVQAFTQHHSRYMVVFRMDKGYSHRSGVYPARMVSENEELVLEE
jgi:hypothetical protein